MKKEIVCLMLILIIIGTLFINKIKFKCNIEGAANSSATSTPKTHTPDWWNSKCDTYLNKPGHGLSTTICEVLEKNKTSLKTL